VLFADRSLVGGTHSIHLAPEPLVVWCAGLRILVPVLGREPSFEELGVFSVMWSEHCSYKNTRPLLKTFPTKSPKILVGAGEENAGQQSQSMEPSRLTSAPVSQSPMRA